MFIFKRENNKFDISYKDSIIVLKSTKMKKITIADKTFKLYQEGIRTFIHIPKDEEGLALKKDFKFGEKISIVNKETGEEFEEIFWHIFDFKENDRFLFLSFLWEKDSLLFQKRRRNAFSLIRENPSFRREEKMYFEYLSESQKHSHAMLKCYTSLFFINSLVNNGDMLTFTYKNQGTNASFVVLDTLKLKNGGHKIDDNIFEVHSLFPSNLLYI